MKKMDESEVKWIIRESRKGAPCSTIAKNAGISTRWVQKICQRYSDVPVGEISYPAPLGRPKKSLPGRREHSAVLSAVSGECGGAVSLKGKIERTAGMHIPHNTIHVILRDADIAEEQPKKSRRRKWVRYERTHSNSMWHTDYKQLPDKRWFICYLDDASRFVTAWGAFPEATTEHAISVLEEAIKRYGKPASIMTDHGSQFYANEAEARKSGESAYEKKLVEPGIRQILARVKHPQTNGKLERFHGKIQRKLHRFEASSYAGMVRDPVSGHVGARSTPNRQSRPSRGSWSGITTAGRTCPWTGKRGDARPGIHAQDGARRGDRRGRADRGGVQGGMTGMRHEYVRQAGPCARLRASTTGGVEMMPGPAAWMAPVHSFITYFAGNLQIRAMVLQARTTFGITQNSSAS